jgi:membrane protease YdiL (CAAX protease family)
MGPGRANRERSPAAAIEAEPGRSRLHWWGTVLYVPVLYGLGWLGSRPLALAFPGWRPDQVDLAGAALALLLLLLTLPWRLRRAWGCTSPWRRLGVRVAPRAGVRAFLGGLGSAALLLAGLVMVALISGRGRWQGDLQLPELLNALALVLGVGFAEELLFRGWLWGELEQQLGPRRATGLQAAIFALVHPWQRLPGLEAMALLVGLVLLALTLAGRRRRDGGCLWGAVGLHGGLVGGWFALQSGLLQLSPSAPAWMVGPAGSGPNPIGGVVGWLGLAMLLVRRPQR